jgi:predicted Zn-dependent peptidase
MIKNIKLSSLESEKRILDNGTSFHFFSDSQMNVIRLEFLFADAGKTNQSKPFVATITNSLLTEGTEKFTAFQIAEALDYYGAFVERTTNMESSSIVFYFLKKHSDNLLQYIEQIIQHPVFPEEQLEISIHKLRQQQKINEQKTSFSASNEMYRRLFPSHPYGSVGSTKDFDTITRNDICSFYNQHLQGQKALTIIASGDITAQFGLSINSFFGKEKRNTNAVNCVNEPPMQIPSSEISLLHLPNSQQVSLRLGKRTITHNNSSFLSLKVLNTVLGGYFGSRLMTNIREQKGLSYGINSGLFSYWKAGVMYVSADVKAEQYDLAMKEVCNEMSRLIDETISKEELDRVKNYLTGDIIRSLDGTLDVSERSAYLLAKQLPVNYFNEYLEIINDITPSKLQSLARQFLNPDSFIKIATGKV